MGQGGGGGVAREKIGSFIWGQIKTGVWWLKWGKNMQLHLNLNSGHLWVLLLGI